MPENSKLELDLPKAFVKQLLERRPAWMKVSDEQFLALVIPQGDFNGYFEKLQQTESKVKDLSRELGIDVNVQAIAPVKRTRKQQPVQPV